jgi:glyoxylase-like metal-dependent hydrolase (beta-lactamase superfamily II)
MSEPSQPAAGVWVFYDESSRLNSGALVGAGGAILVDPAPSGAALDLLDDFVREARHEVLAVVLTHVRPEAPALIRWPSALFISTSAVPMGRQALPLANWEALAVRGSDNLAVYNRKERILFSGEVLTGSEIPSLPGGADRYLESLESIEDMDPRLLVPSRGEVAQGKRAIRARIERERGYVHSLVRHALSAMQAGAGLDRTLEVARSIYEDYPFVEAHLDNVRSVWWELSGASSQDSGTDGQ